MKWKIALLLMLMGLPGVVATSWLALPLLVDASSIPVPLETLKLATALQSSIFVLVAAILGTWLAPKVGVSAPVIMAIAGGGKVLESFRPQLASALAGGCIGASVIVAFHAFSPEALTAVQPETPLPLAVRILYGGITEEILLRWGLMTSIAWLGWKVFQNNYNPPSPAVMGAAIVLSALIFGLSHLPPVALSLPELSASVIAYVTMGNTLFGLVAGYLFWRYGIEAAIAAHVFAHIFAFIIRG